MGPGDPVLDGLTLSEIAVWECSRSRHGWWMGTAQTLLDPEEAERASLLARRADVERFVLGRGVVRVVVAGLFGVEAKKIRLHAGDRGKPFLPDHPELRFNVAHSGDVVVVAVRRAVEVGVDVEQIRPEAVDSVLARRFMTASELESMAALDPTSAIERFFEVWVRKEAYVKGLGRGLSLGLETFSVSLGSEAPQPVDDPRSSETWSTLGLSVESGHRAAVASAGTDWHVRVGSLDALLSATG
jgi:4'-phosphopantetheinyl transferase